MRHEGRVSRPAWRERSAGQGIVSPVPACRTVTSMPHQRRYASLGADEIPYARRVLATMMRRVISMRTAIIAIASIATSATWAQDLSPALDPVQLGQGHVMSAAIRAQASRSVRRGATAQQIASCAQKARFRAEYGADHPKIRRLYSLCRSIGR